MVARAVKVDESVLYDFGVSAFAEKSATVTVVE
jgi:hypothetical protein